MTRIKICGITSHADAAWCAERGADAIGFVFAPSPRRITPDQAGEIMRELEPFVTGVGVFVDSPPEEVKAALGRAGCALAQLHGSEPPSYMQALVPYGAIKALRVGARLDAAAADSYKGARALLLDTEVPGLAGGTGRRFDPLLARPLIEAGWRVIVAGGLSPENVAGVVRRVRPYGVDVSSGVEAEPGRKDRGLVAGFIAAVRAADQELG